MTNTAGRRRRKTVMSSVYPSPRLQLARRLTLIHAFLVALLFSMCPRNTSLLSPYNTPETHRDIPDVPVKQRNPTILPSATRLSRPTGTNTRDISTERRGTRTMLIRRVGISAGVSSPPPPRATPVIGF